MVLLIIMNLCFAAALPLLKLAIMGMDPLLVVAIRMIIPGILLLCYQAATSGIYFSKLNKKLIFVTALVAIYGVCVGEALALASMDAAKANILWALLPLMTAAISHLLVRERLTPLQWAALLLATIGMLVLMGGTEGGISLHQMSHWTKADLLMVGAVTSAAAGYFLLRQLLDEGHGVILSAGSTMLIGGFMSLLTMLITGGKEPLYSVHWWPTLGYIFLVILLVNLCGLLLQNWLLQRYSVTLLALSSFITPVTGVILSIGWLGEQWYSYYGIAGSCIAAGLWLMYTNEPQRQGYRE